jgi:hypothetical protein
MKRGHAELPESIADLTGALVSIGFGLAGKASRSPVNMEDALFLAAVEALDEDDGRLLILLMRWLELHSPRINADRLVRLILAYRSKASTRFRAFWRAFAEWKQGDIRFRRLQKLYRGPRVDLSPGTALQVRRCGEDPRFAGTIVRVPGNNRNRAGDVLEPSELARANRAYYWRTIIGPTYRADMWALLESEPSLSVRELAARSYGSVQSAWTAKRDSAVIAGAARTRRSRRR